MLAITSLILHKTVRHVICRSERRSWTSPETVSVEHSLDSQHFAEFQPFQTVIRKICRFYKCIKRLCCLETKQPPLSQEMGLGPPKSTGLKFWIDKLQFPTDPQKVHFVFASLYEFNLAMKSLVQQVSRQILSDFLWVCSRWVLIYESGIYVPRRVY